MKHHNTILKDVAPVGGAVGSGAVGGGGGGPVVPPQDVSRDAPQNAPQNAPLGAPPETRGTVPPPVSAAALRPRHLALVLSFLLLVLGPIAVSGWYLWTRAADQYGSVAGFSVRSEDRAPPVSSLLGQVALSPGTGGASDAEVLFQFIQSHDLVARLDQRLDLRAIWGRADPARDPIYAYRGGPSTEDLLAHWNRKVRVLYDVNTGMISLRVLAFTPQEAQGIAQHILAESAAMINGLNTRAQADFVRFAQAELDRAVDRLKRARTALTQFRNRTQIVDPAIDLQGQAALLNSLNAQLAEALIDLNLLLETTRAGDPRVAQAERRVRVIQDRVADEKRSLGLRDGDSASAAFATLIEEYERLQVDRDFAEQTYTAALANYDAAQAEARRQSRYLAVHIRPSLAGKAEYPKRLTILGLFGLFAGIAWAIAVLAVYSIRDRR